jgi:hypothetical protein
MELGQSLKELQIEIDLFVCRPATLVLDLVLMALAIDVLESADAAYYTTQSKLPHKAYSNARLAFEGSQQALVLATHENYPGAGARASVYFESKDAFWRAALERKKGLRAPNFTEDQWLEESVDRMSRIWDSMAEGQGTLLNDALSMLRKEAKKRPDNWLHENMAVRQHAAYALFAAAGGRSSPPETAQMNQVIYQTLCRETHARPRLDSIRISHNRGSGSVQVQLEPRSPGSARMAVLAGTDLSVRETVAALRWQRVGTT